MSSIIGTLFACYDEKEKTNLHRELHSRIGKGIRKQVKLYGVKKILQISHDEGNSIWKQAVDHFASKEITYQEVYQLVSDIFDDFESSVCENCKYYGDSHCHSKEVDIMLDEGGDADSFPTVDKDFGCNKYERKDVV